MDLGISRVKAEVSVGLCRKMFYLIVEKKKQFLQSNFTIFLILHVSKVKVGLGCA